MSPTITSIVYLTSGLSGCLSFIYFITAYRKAEKKYYFDYLFFLSSLSLLVFTSTLAFHYQHTSGQTTLLYHLILSGLVLGIALTVYTMPKVLLAIFYHPRANNRLHLFANIGMITTLMIPVLWLWPSRLSVSFPLIIATTALIFSSVFCIVTIIKNKSDIFKTTSIKQKLAIGIFIFITIGYLIVELILKTLVSPTHLLTICVSYTLWNGLVIFLDAIQTTDTLATISGIQALKDYYTLTNDELLLVYKLTSGASSNEIAIELNLSIEESDTLIKKIYNKVNIQSRFELLEKIHTLQ